MSCFDSVGIEFNFACDPLAASRVLEEFQTVIRIVTFEMTCMCTLPFELFENELFKSTTVQGRFFTEVSRFLFDFCKQHENNPELYVGFNSCDAVCMACILDESIIEETKRVYACVEPFGQLASGHMISDWYDHFKRQPNVEIIVNINKDKFEQLFRLCVKE